MSSYLITNYKGKYTLQAEIDKNTNDFCRDENGTLDNYSDIWIECQGKGKIFHYAKNILQYYCPSLVRGHNIIKSIYSCIFGDIESLNNEYETMYSNLTNNGIIFDVEETDSEILFKFKTNNLEKLEQFIKPKTSTPNRSPFSVKNLRKQYNKNNKNKEDGGNKYTISNEKQAEYKDITSQISRDDISVYNKINKGFLVVLSKKMRKPVDTLKAEMKKENLKFKEYVNFLGDDYWNKYLEYIKNYLKEN